MRLFNTLSDEIEDFDAAGEVSLYVCGVTPYDTTHLGHARTYLVFDVLIRHLLHLGYKVNYVQNITDVDDSILVRAREMGESYEDLGRFFVGVYLEDSAQLGIIPADAYPTATSAIPQITQVIEGLIDGGHAYEIDGDVFFRIASFEEYGKLSRLDRPGMIAQEREQVLSTVDDPRKEDPLDFPLWRAQREGEPSWPSPWGPGRPGWHIECSTLVMTHLGSQIDIHGGGDDLIFPHHENEIAQSETFSGMHPFARTWVHVAMARLGGEKMSKSEGNMMFVRDLLETYSADAIRLYVLQTHHRTPLDFDPAALDRAAALAARLKKAADLPVRAAGVSQPAVEAEREFDARLNDDLDTPGAIAALEGVAGTLLDETGPIGYQERRVLRSLAQRLGLQLTARPTDTGEPA